MLKVKGEALCQSLGTIYGEYNSSFELPFHFRVSSNIVIARINRKSCKSDFWRIARLDAHNCSAFTNGQITPDSAAAQ